MNKYKAMGYRTGAPGEPLEHIIGGTPTKWMNTNANRFAKCPKCGSDPGYLCQTPKGNKAQQPHIERLLALPKEIADYSRGKL
jgi:hypothetical protein